jgi:hypothetical protein
MSFFFANMALSSLVPTWTETRNDQNILNIFFLVSVSSGHSAPRQGPSSRGQGVDDGGRIHGPPALRPPLSTRPHHACSRRRQSQGRRRRWLNDDLHDGPVPPSRLFLLQMKPREASAPRPRHSRGHGSHGGMLLAAGPCKCNQAL